MIEYELKKSAKFHCFALMIKYTFKTMGVMDYLLVTRVNDEKQLS